MSDVARIKGPRGRRLHCLGGTRRLKRLALAALPAALLFATSASPAGAVVTIGSNLERVPDSGANYSPRPTFSNSALAPDLRAPGGVSSPVNGTVVQWRIRVGDATRVTNLRIIRPLGGGLFMGAGTSPPVVPPINATTSYDVQLPIRIGDFIGIDCCEFAAASAKFFVTGAAIRNEWQPSLTDGGPGRPPFSTNLYEVAVNAEITSTFTVDQITRNKKNGTATLTVSVAHAGELIGAGKGIKVASSGETVTAPGSVPLLIKANSRKKKKKLNSTGKVKVKVEITYAPTGGETVTKPVTVKLIKR
jgi:hypothetical protein